MTHKLNKQEVIIGIPLYKATPSQSEFFSLEQCCKVLGKHPFTLITHKGVDLDAYRFILKQYNIAYEVTYFHENFFSNVEGYNQLLWSPVFYKAFSEFKFLLIHQLDAFVFSDQLLHWCSKNYDYIGAPWLNAKWPNTQAINRQLPFFTRFPFLFRLLKGKDGLVGNGGFSLRKVSTHVKYAELYANSVKTLQLNEDLFWSKYVAAKHQDFTIPLIREALSFAIENDPGNAFKMLNDTLPFGCHAWYKHDQTDWDVIFKKAGFDPAQIPIG